MKKIFAKTKRTMMVVISAVMLMVCMTVNAMPASASSSFYNRSLYPVKSSGIVYAQDSFSFSVDNGNVSIHSVYQSSFGYPAKGWRVTNYGGSYINVDTYWGSNPTIKIWKWYLPTFKTVTCHYTIYSNGTVTLNSKS